MSILNKIKKGVASSGSNKGKVVYIKADQKVRVRFLQEIEDGLVISNHDKFDDGINFFDQEVIHGERHPLQDDDDIRHRDAYIWSVYDYDAKEVKLFVGYANNFSPLPSLVAMYETYGTIMDRDYVLQRDGSGTNTRYSVVPMDKVKFKTKAKPYSEKKTLEILDKAFPAPVEDDDEEDKKGKKQKKSKGRKKEEEPEDDDEEEEEENEYASMSPKELYMECVERGLKAKKKQKKDYYIDMLMEDDLENEEEDDWEDDEEDEDGDDW